MVRARLSDADTVAAMYAAYEAGMSTYAIAARWEVSQASVSLVFRRAGLPCRSRGRKRIDPAETAAMHDAYTAGVPVTVIAEHWRITVRAVYGRFRAAGLATRRRTPRINTSNRPAS
jgi:hypothetical protein